MYVRMYVCMYLYMYIYYNVAYILLIYNQCSMNFQKKNVLVLFPQQPRFTPGICESKEGGRRKLTNVWVSSRQRLGWDPQAEITLEWWEGTVEIKKKVKKGIRFFILDYIGMLFKKKKCCSFYATILHRPILLGIIGGLKIGNAIPPNQSHGSVGIPVLRQPQISRIPIESSNPRTSTS